MRPSRIRRLRRCRAASHPRGGPATAAPAAAARHAGSPAAPAAPARETAPIGDAAYLRNPAPDYPAFAQDQGWEGRVVLRVHVLANGSPDSVEVRTSSGRRMLDTAAVAAVKRWTFVPAKRGDEAVDGWVNVPIDFAGLTRRAARHIFRNSHHERYSDHLHRPGALWLLVVSPSSRGR